ncbi:MAG: hypothetical protein KGJ13_10970 [Patescibacteria group bacterium]|nr:hypothetical protein [Patescibacteria group bacterium]
MRLVSEPDTPQRTAEMTKALEQLASSDPADALTIAMQESDAKLREALLQGVLRGWGSLDPSAAADWARSEDTIDHGLAMASVMNGAVKHPDQAIQLTASLSQRDPAQIQSYGQYLVFALTRVGDFSAAADFAVKGAPDIRPNWVVMAYYNWAVKQQDVAVAAALKLTDPSAQLTAFRAAISGWAHSDPKTLVDTAENFPEGQDRKFALTAGLRSWIEKDPAAAADWISHHEYTPEMDAALEE